MRHLHHKYIYLITYPHVNEPLEGLKHRHTGPLHTGPLHARQALLKRRHTTHM